MKNFVMEGKTITLIAPYAVTAGQGLQVGSIFGVASADAAYNAEVEVLLEGVFTFFKSTGTAWSAGSLIYWDNGSRLCTTTVGTNKLIGVNPTAALSTENFATVRLNAAFIS